MGFGFPAVVVSLVQINSQKFSTGLIVSYIDRGTGGSLLPHGVVLGRLAFPEGDVEPWWGLREKGPGVAPRLPGLLGLLCCEQTPVGNAVDPGL